MTVPVLTQGDLASLSNLFPTTFDFSDAERRGVLLEANSRDVQAAPGSGKTTLLAAKLQLLAGKWQHSGRGICVLSHTNVARDEIAKRLSISSWGAQLLGYPHFVGTIHAFINQFLGLPLLRSDAKAVDVIDNDVFASRALALLHSNRNFATLKTWVQKNPQRGIGAIVSLRYRGSNLDLDWESGGLPSPGTTSWLQAKDLKDELSSRGVFRFDDMFAFAERLLVRFPDMRKRLSHRFPLVLIDEMQDTSWDQEDLLSRIFDETVVMQRFGDRNQRILSSAAGITNLSFPRHGHLNVTTTKRFPAEIAAVVRSVQEHGEPVGPNDDAEGCRPVLIVYETAQVGNVIDAFGKYVLSQFSDDALGKGAVKAICARKQGDSSTLPGRHLVDYWPPFQWTATIAARTESIHHLLADPANAGVVPIGLERRARDVKRAILLALRAAGCPAVDEICDANFLLRRLEGAGHDISPVRLLCHRLTVGRGQTLSANWGETIDGIYNGLSGLFPPVVNRAAFGALAPFVIPSSAGLDSDAINPNSCLVQHDGRSVNVQIATTASVKGETHLATLVLEAHGHPAKCHDLEGALGSIATGTPLAPAAKESTRSYYRRLYVASSRPSKLLCLAMNRERASVEHIAALQDAGWEIIAL